MHLADAVLLAELDRRGRFGPLLHPDALDAGRGRILHDPFGLGRRDQDQRAARQVRAAP